MTSDDIALHSKFADILGDSVVDAPVPNISLHDVVTTAPPKAPAPQATQSKKMRWLLIIVVVVLLIAAAYVYKTRLESNPDDGDEEDELNHDQEQPVATETSPHDDPLLQLINLKRHY